MVSLRPATPNDVPGILAIMNHNILHSTTVYDYDPKNVQEMEAWLQEKQEAGWPVIVADENGSVVGYGTYGTFRYKQGYRFTVEHSVYVAEGYAGKGIGKLLLSELITIAKASGYHTMIGGIDAQNTGSIAFHKKFGFKEAGTIKEAGFKFGRWLDVTFMQLILD